MHAICRFNPPKLFSDSLKKPFSRWRPIVTGISQLKLCVQKWIILHLCAEERFSIATILLQEQLYIRSRREKRTTHEIMHVYFFNYLCYFVHFSSHDMIVYSKLWWLRMLRAAETPTGEKHSVFFFSFGRSLANKSEAAAASDGEERFGGPNECCGQVKIGSRGDKYVTHDFGRWSACGLAHWRSIDTRKFWGAADDDAFPIADMILVGCVADSHRSIRSFEGNVYLWSASPHVTLPQINQRLQMNQIVRITWNRGYSEDPRDAPVSRAY